MKSWHVHGSGTVSFCSLNTEIVLKFETLGFRVQATFCGGDVTVIVVRYISNIIAVVAIIIWWMFSF